MSFSKTELLTTGQIAKTFHVSTRTVFRWLASGKLRAIRIGNVTRVRREDLDAFFQAHLTTTTDDPPVRREDSQ
ncbi:MAG: helix-turn-helix domain-containing protein [Chloroflexi bacterium]|nr:helix-turn-helix domain-containing protein [Chloroflexota bacterium]